MKDEESMVKQENIKQEAKSDKQGDQAQQQSENGEKVKKKRGRKPKSFHLQKEQ